MSTKPALILQHLGGDGPAYLATWLARRGLPFEVRNTEAGEPYPAHLDGYSALAVLGGEMSANDPLPSLRQAEVLILEAMARGRPVIGHCLGGQLMARALGAPVGPSIAPEIGWHPMTLAGHAQARDWFGDGEEPTVFQWHEEAFALPPGAVALAGSAACAHQAFAIGPHLAMQFHVEVDEEKLLRWSTLDTPAYHALQRRHATVQGGACMRQAMRRHLPAQQALADRIYARWWAAAAACA
jgi:GMP synthase-like glutamine amidotransferase